MKIPASSERPLPSDMSLLFLFSRTALFRSPSHLLRGFRIESWCVAAFYPERLPWIMCIRHVGSTFRSDRQQAARTPKGGHLCPVLEGKLNGVHIPISHSLPKKYVIMLRTCLRECHDDNKGDNCSYTQTGQTGHPWIWSGSGSGYRGIPRKMYLSSITIYN